MSAELRIRYDVVRFSDYDASGFLGIQCDAFGEDQSGVPAVEAVTPFGLAARPPDPQVDPGGEVVFGAGMLNFWEGPESYGFPLHDPRFVPGLPELQKGESALYAIASNFVRCHADGRISAMCTTDGTADGQRVFLEVGPAGFTLAGPWAQLRHDSLGVHYQHVSGACFDIGGIAGLLGPLERLSSYWHVEAGVITLLGTTVQLGTGAFDAAAKSTPTLTTMTAMQTAIAGLQASCVSLAAAVSALTAILANAAAAPAAAAAAVAVGNSAAAVSASSAAVTAAATTVPAQAVQVA